MKRSKNILIKQAKKEILERDKRWFYQKKKSQVDYNSNGKGSISVPRLIQNKPCFKKPDPASEWSKKTLVLADWTRKRGHLEYLAEINALIEELIFQGFTLYMWQEQQLLPLSGPLDLEQISKITCELESTIEQSAAAKQISREQLYILDDIELNRLAQAKKKGEPSININYVSGEESTTILKQKYNSLINIKFPVDINDKQKIKALEERISLPVSFQFRQLQLYNQSLDELFNNHKIADLVPNLPNKDLSFHESFLSEIEEIEIWDELSNPDQLVTLFEKCNHLTSFVIRNCKGINKQHLKKILHHTPELASIRLTGYEEVLKDADWPINLTALESIFIASSNLSSLSLHNLLRQTKQLESLSLMYCNNLKDRLSSISLGSLEALNLEASDLSAQNLYTLLHSTEKLKTFTMSSINGLLDEMAQVSLPSLETFKVDGSDLTASNLQNLLFKVPKLKKFELTHCNNLSEQLAQVSLSSLETLEIGNCNLTAQSLQNLLHNTPKLKTLKLTQCENLSGQLAQVSLSSLETLEIEECNLTAQSLQNLLHNTPNLKTLKLTKCGNLTEQLVKVSLPSLETLQLTKCNLTAKNLQNLLYKTPRLKMLDVDACLNLNGEFDPISLPSLETLKLAQCNFTTESLQNLIHNRPQLKILKLKSCINLLSELSQVSLPSLEEMKISNCSFSNQSLQNLMHDMPRLINLKLEYYNRPLRKLSFTQLHVVNCSNKIKSQTKTFSPIAVSVRYNFKSFDHTNDIFIEHTLA